MSASVRPASLIVDAGGKPFALATFNGMSGPGSNEIRLTVFGKLLHDKVAGQGPTEKSSPVLDDKRPDRQFERAVKETSNRNATPVLRKTAN